MSELLSSVSQQLLAPGGLELDSLPGILHELNGPGIDAADLYFQSQVSESWMLEDGIVKEGSFNLDQGVGVRAQSGEKTGFAYSNAITAEALKQAAVAARSISRAGQNGSVQAFKAVVPARLYAGENPLDVLSRAEKVELLKQIDAATRALDPRIQQVTVSMAGVWEQILVAASDGSLAADSRPLVRFNVSVIVEQNGRRERGGHGGGGRTDYRYFLQEDRAMGYAREALRQALVNLEAIPAPAGTLPVVMGAGWSGVLLHEAVGHGLEGDFNRKGSSAYSGRVGEKVASSLCTIVDDGTLAGRRGSLSVDDEGTPSNCNVLIENGVLKGYMQDKLNARLMGVARTGNGRRESYAHLPMPRMTNTYMLAGESDPQEIIAGGEGYLLRQPRRWPGRYHQRQVRVLHQRGLPDRERQDHHPGERRHPDRQRSGSDEPGVHGRQRPGPGQWRGNLREGRSVGAGRRRPADPEDRCDPRRRHRRLRPGPGAGAAKPSAGRAWFRPVRGCT